MHDDEVLGKAYDARLMRRLLAYLNPYRGQVALAAGAIILHSLFELAPPYLTKLVIDTYIPAGNLSGLGIVAIVFLLMLTGSFALEYLQTSTLQMIGQRIMFDLRMQVYGHLQRLDLRFYDRNPVGRLMTRVTTDVDVLNELFTSGVVSVFGDLFTLVGIMGVLARLAPCAGGVLGAAPHRADHAVVPVQRPRVVPDRADLDRPDQRVSAGADYRDDHRAPVPP
jgi:ATP-binding cassette, subfamily B, multidrug efflux pump